MPTALVTGAARGIGHAITARLVADGWTVHAGVRKAGDGERLQAELGDRIVPVLLDVTDGAQIDALADALPARLDALVNNAGIVEAGPIEALPVTRLRHQLEVNVVGQVGVTSACIPKLRAAQGRIVFIGSISGKVSSPMLGAYGASKFAIEAIADALRVELRPWGIGVTVIEPGSIDTAIWRDVQDTVTAVEDEMSPEHKALYGKQTQQMRKLTKVIQGNTTKPEKVADAVAKALTADRAPARRMVGADAYLQIGRAHV